MTRSWTIPGLPEGPLPGSVDEVLSCLGVEYNDRAWGDEASGCCPIHDDVHPSASFNTSSGLWNCFGCGEGGSLVHLAELMLDVPYARARRWLRAVDYGAEVAAREPDAEVEYDESVLYDFDTPPTSALRERGISSKAARHFGIKWCPDDKAWVIPIRDADTGVLRGWQTKSATQTRTTDGTRKSRTLFGIDKFRPGSAAILVESPLDCAVLLTAGLDGGLAYGSRGRLVRMDRVRRPVTAGMTLMTHTTSGCGSRGMVPGRSSRTRTRSRCSTVVRSPGRR